MFQVEILPYKPWFSPHAAWANKWPAANGPAAASRRCLAPRKSRRCGSLIVFMAINCPCLMTYEKCWLSINPWVVGLRNSWKTRKSMIFWSMDDGCQRQFQWSFRLKKRSRNSLFAKRNHIESIWRSVLENPTMASSEKIAKPKNLNDDS